MQSQQKLQQRVRELLGPPGPDSDPMELALRSVVAITAPALEGLVSGMTADELDTNLEKVALFFLDLKSDGSKVSTEFRQELDKLDAIEATATDAPGELAAGATPDPTQESTQESAGSSPDPSSGAATGPSSSDASTASGSESGSATERPPAPPYPTG